MIVLKPVLLCILDGVGMRKEIYGNAFLQAKTPNFDDLWKKYPHSYLEASGSSVGLPEGQMGNSEVGHLNIGAGRIVYQPLQLITQKIKDKSFFENEHLLDVIHYAKKNKTRLQIFGLLSDGGIHSHINHLMAIIDLCQKEDMHDVYFHVFTDGRDTLSNVALSYLDQLQQKIEETGIGKIATITGRYYAMDRDNRYDRIKRAYDACVKGKGKKFSTYQDVIEHHYEKGITDEFIEPSVLDINGCVKKGDGLLVFNYRPDRLRELFSAFTNPKFNGFKRKKIPNLKLVTMMPVSNEVIYEAAFTNEKMDNTLGEYVSKQGLKQLRIAETEKYAHVTYFLDGGEEKSLTECDRILIPSPKVATYDLAPAMSANEITDTLLQKLDENLYDLVILNFANGDMLGHTGNMEAAIQSLEIMDICLGKLYQKIKEKNGLMIVTADHGNCEFMLDENQNKITSHTTSLVPFIVTKTDIALQDGKLSDIAPTVLSLLKLDIPVEMTGKSLLRNFKKRFGFRFWFILLSCLFLMGIILNYGYRFFHFYHLAHQERDAQKSTLHDMILRNSPLVASGDGLYFDQNRYVFKGMVNNNYVYYSNRYFRIVRVNQDGSIVLIADDIVTSLVWNYKDTDYTNSYIRSWLNASDKDYTGIFYHSLEHPDNYIMETSYCVDVVDGENLTCKQTVTDQVGLLSIAEYKEAMGHLSYLNIGKYWWTSNSSMDGQVWYVFSEGGIHSKSNMHDIYYAYGVRPVITLKPDVHFVSGNGSKENPYLITPPSQQLNIGSYVTWNDNIWQVLDITEEDIRLMKHEVLTIDSKMVSRIFSNRSNQYNPNDLGSLAYYLNHNYLQSLSNSNLIVDALWYNGTYGDSYDYQNIYGSTVQAKVGMVTVGNLYGSTDQSFVTMTGMHDDLLYFVSNQGMLSTADIETEFAVKPVVAISKSVKILGGNGMKQDPFVIG